MSEFKRYRKKPVVVSAKQLGPQEAELIYTLEGTVQANPGDWVIIGVKGERYPYRDDIFQATYEPMEENT